MAAVPEVLQQQDEDRSKVRPYTFRRQAGGPPTSRGPTFLSSSQGDFGAARVLTRDAPAGPRAPFVLPAAENRRGTVPRGPVSGAERARRASGDPRMCSYVKRVLKRILASRRLEGEREIHLTCNKRQFGLVAFKLRPPPPPGKTLFWPKY